MILSCIIIEDEPLAMEKLEGFISKVPFLKLEASFDSSLEGLQYLKTKGADILFLDIQMEQLTGIQLLETIVRKPYVVITSAYSEYALKGYELQVCDYLLKPYSFERFLASVNRIFDDCKQKKLSSESPANIFIKDGYKLENVNKDDILYIEGMNEYLQLVLPHRKITTRQNFKTLLNELNDKRFVQVHKSWVVSLPKIERIENQRIIIGEKRIPIGDTYRDHFFEIITKNL